MNTRFKNGLLHFDYKASELKPKEKASRKNLEKALAAIIKTPKEKRTFENTPLAYTKAFEDYSAPFETAMFLSYVSPDKTLRDAATELQHIVSNYMIEVATRKALYHAIKEYADSLPVLGVPEKRLLDDMMKGFKKSGLHLPESKLAKLRALGQKKAPLAIKYSERLREHKDPLAVTKEELKGLEDNFINRLEKTKDGKYLISLDYPDYGPFMMNAESESARKALEYKFGRRGEVENVKLLEEILSIRRQIAVVLGEKNFASGKLEYRMAKNPETVTAFLKDLAKKLRPAAKKEDAKILAFKQKQTGTKERELAPYNNAYWFNKYRKHFFGLDPEKIKEFFPSEHAVETMIAIFGEILGIKFERATVPVWHKDVRAFKVLNAKDGALVSYLYLDLYPRDGKYKHAMCVPLESGHALPDGAYQPPFTAIIANFNPPSGSVPSLLKHGEVETLFHEFGHAMHSALTTAKYSSLAGTAVTWDFVEAPSQMFENWMWDKKIIKRMSKHYKTSKPLPDAVLNKMLRAKMFGAAGGYLRQDALASYDMFLHTSTKYVDTTKAFYDITKSVRGGAMTKNLLPQASFEHIVGGYDAGYYGYLWSEVIAQDFFSIFKKHGIMDKKTGAAFRDKILAVGGTYEEEDIVKNFLGRPLSNKAFLKSLGVK